MKTLKDRNTVKISVAAYEQMRDEIFQTALGDGAKQGIAICLIALERTLGWRKKRLERIVESADEILHWPDIFGKDVTGDDAIGYLRKEYGIDLDALDLEVKSDSN